jgi:hypothetical protein
MKYDRRTWHGDNFVSTYERDVFFWTCQWDLRFHKMQDISGLAKKLLVAEEELCSWEQVIFPP